MSKKIDHILEVLSIVRSQYLLDKWQSLETVRIDATTTVAERHGIWVTTVLDKYQRGLYPHTYGTKAFDDLVSSWLISNSSRLQEILLYHSSTEIDRSNVITFFKQKNSPPLKTNEVSDLKITFAKNPNLYERMQHLTQIIEEKSTEYEAFDPTNLNDERTKVARELVQRRGQKKFRETLFDLYEGRCAISGTDVAETLEAAHITPYLGDHTDHPTNGLLLRADIHNLFDFGLIAIDEVEYMVIVSVTLQESSYQEFNGRRLYLPKDREYWPNREALKKHREEAQLTLIQY